MADEKKYSAKDFEEYYSSREEGEQTIIDKMFEQINIAKKLENVYGNVQKQIKASRSELVSINAQLVEVGQAVLEKQKVINGLTEQISSAQVVMQESIKKEIELKQTLIKMEEDITYIQRNKEELQKKVNESIEKETKEILKIEEIKKRILKNDGALKANLDAMTTNKTKLVGVEDKIRLAEEEARKIEQQGLGYTGEYETALNKILLLKKKKADLEEKNTQYQRDEATLLSRADILSYNLEQAEHNRNSTLADRINLNVDLAKANEAEVKLTEERKKVLSDISNIESTLKEKAKEIEGLNKEKNKQEDEKVGLLLKQEGLFTKQSQLMVKIKKLESTLVFAQLLKMAYERFVQLDAAAENFRRETGFSIDQMKQLRKDAEALNVQFADMGVSIEKVYASAKALTDVFGRTSLVTKEALQNVSLLSANLGVAEADSANVLAIFQGLGNATEQAAMNVIKVGAGISEKAGVPFSLVMKDIANASEQTTALIGANPSKLMKSAIAARALGTDLNKIVASQRKLLDFSSSINDELEASAMLGKNISFQKARQLAYEGDIEGAAKATLESVKAAGDFDKMSVYQREALAKASGMELKDLTKMMAVDKQREAIMNGTDEAKKATLKAQEAELENLKKIDDLNNEDLVKQNEKVLMQQKMQGVMTRLKNLMESLTVAFADILEPIITPLMDVLVPGMKFLAFVIKLIIFPFKQFANLIMMGASYAKKLGAEFGWIKTGADFIKEMTEKIQKFYQENKDFINYMSGAVGGILTVMFFGKMGLGKMMEMISAPFKMLNSARESLMKKIFNKGAVAEAAGKIGEAGGAKGGVDGAKKAAESAKATKNIPAGTGVKDFLKNLAAGLRAMGDSKVLFGSLNLIPASIGLTAMIAGSVGAKAVELINPKKISSEFEGLSSGLKQMGSSKVLLGALSLIPASVGLIAMILGTVGAKFIERIDGKSFSSSMAGIATGLEKMASGKVLLGAASTLVSAAALAIMIPVAIGAAILGLVGKPIEMGLNFLAKGISHMANPKVLLGALGIGLVGASIIPFAFAMQMFSEVDWTSVGIGALALVGFTAAAFGLGTILASGVGAAIFGAGVIGIAALGAALIPFGVAALAAGAGVKMLGEGISGSVDPIMSLAEIDLTKTALGITAVGAALAAFGGGSAAAGLGSFVGNFLGGDPIEKMEKLAAVGDKLKVTADSITAISQAAAQFSAVNSFSDAIIKLSESLVTLSSSINKFDAGGIAKLSQISAATGTTTNTTTAAPATSGVETKLDELISLMKQGYIVATVDIDKLSGRVAKTSGT